MSRIITQVTHNADDFIGEFRAPFRRPKALPNCLFAWPELSGGRLVDQNAAGAFSPIAAIQPTSLLQRHPHGAQWVGLFDANPIVQ